jgi:hypothetical protein
MRERDAWNGDFSVRTIPLQRQPDPSSAPCLEDSQLAKEGILQSQSNSAQS